MSAENSPTPTPAKPLFSVNEFLLQTIERDPNLSDADRDFFKELCGKEPAPKIGWPAKQAAQRFATLLRRNYVYLDDFGAWSVIPADRRSLRTKLSDFVKKIFGRGTAQ